MQSNTIHPVLADCSTSISELKANPMAVVDHGDGFPVAVFNRSKPVFYCVPAELFEIMVDKLEDIELAQVVLSRKNQAEIEVDINDL